jgi:hypothetical protein
MSRSSDKAVARPGPSLARGSGSSSWPASSSRLLGQEFIRQLDEKNLGYGLATRPLHVARTVTADAAGVEQAITSLPEVLR